MRLTVNGRTPQVDPAAFVAPTAVLTGEVIVEAGANIWFGAVLRAEFGRILVGRAASVQDNVVVHVDEGGETVIGPECIVGHGAVLEGCVLERGAVVGMNAVILPGARLGEGAVVAAGSVVPEGMIIPAGHLAAGVPAEVKKPVSGRSRFFVEHGASDYQRMLALYREAGHGT